MGAFGTGFLGDLSVRLQRLLGFDGFVPVSFDGTAVPVIITGDATLPGYGNQQGRRFIVSSGAVPAGAFFYWAPSQDIIITRIRYTNDFAGVGTQEWRLIAPTTAPGATPVPAGFFLDRSLSLFDRPPVLTYVNPAATAGTVLQTITQAATSPLVGVYTEFCLDPFCMSVGMQMGILNNSAGLNPRFEIWGRTL